MKRHRLTKFHYIQRIVSLALVVITIVATTSSVFATEANKDSSGDRTFWEQGNLNNFSVTQFGEGLQFSGVYEDVPFCITGRVYNIYDNVNNNKIYVVEENPDLYAQAHIINLEFERSAKAENLEVDNQHLVGLDVIRLAAYIDGKIYYTEHEITIPEIIIRNIEGISESSNIPVLQSIISNSTWYTHFGNQEMTVSIAPQVGTAGTEVRSAPLLDSSLDSVDRDTIATIGASKFTVEQLDCRLNSSYGYVIQCVEWPQSSGSILTSCLYYSVVRNIPSSSNDTASCQLRLVTDRQYRWISDTNTIIPYFAGTDLAMYDVKLAIECAWYNDNSGYDFIYERTVSTKSSGQTNAALNIGKAFIQCFDKYNLVSITDAIFDSFTRTSDTDGTCTWSDDYNTHYTMLDHNKPKNTFLRGVRIDTDGRILQEEGDYVLLKAKVKDRDSVTSSANTSVTKAIKYAVSYNLRSKNAVFGWLFGGDVLRDLTKESYRTYTR